MDGCTIGSLARVELLLLNLRLTVVQLALVVLIVGVTIML